MTSKLTITRERLAELVAFKPLPGTDINSATRGEWMAMAAELQERRKADSEPVATLDVQSRRPDGNKFALVFSSAAHKLPDDVYFLYRHAQPALEGYSDFEEFWSSYIHPLAQDDELKGFAWDIWCASMLQAQSDDGEPTDDERIMAIEGIHNCERCGDKGWVVGEMGITRCACGQAASVCTCPSGDGSLRWPCPSHPGKSPVWIGVDWAKGCEPGNSPVIPDGYVMVPKEPTPEILAVISEAIRAMRGSAATYARVLAAAPQEVKP